LRYRRADPARHRRSEDPLAHGQPAAPGQPSRLRPGDRRVGAAVGRGGPGPGRAGSLAGRSAALTVVLGPRLTRLLLTALLLAFVPVLGHAAPPDPVTAHVRAGNAEAIVELTIAPGWHVNAHTPRDEFLVPTTLEIEAPAGQKAAEVSWPEPVERTLAISPGKALLLYEGKLRLSATLSGTAAAGAPPLRARLRFQACNDSTCLPPKTLELTAEEPAHAGAAGAGNAVADAVARWGWGVTFLWVGLLGLALNLTPCVYPMISITVAYFGGRTAAESTRLGHALLYVLGICITFSALGVAAALTGSLFGAAMQQPVVLGGIALLMVGLALGNFGLYQVRMPS